MITAQGQNRTCITNNAYLSGGSSCEIIQGVRYYVSVALLFPDEFNRFWWLYHGKTATILVRGGPLSTDP